LFYQKGFCFSSSPYSARIFSSGFTIVELLIALILLAIALVLAAPSLQRLVANNQIVSTNNSIVTGLNMARSTAITTGDDITICPSSNGTTCAAGSWDSGWIIFNDADNDAVVDAGEILRVVSLEGDISNSGFGGEIVFRSDGTTDMGSNATITNCYGPGGSSGTCMNVDINQFGLIESSKYQTSPAGGS